MKDILSGFDGRDVGLGEKSLRGWGERYVNEDVLIWGGKYVDCGSRWEMGRFFKKFFDLMCREYRF